MNSELRTYDKAVGEIHVAIGQLLHALDDRDQLDEVIDSFRADQQRLVAAMATVEDLMRSPSDPYHDRLIASYSQIRRFLPGLIAAIDFESTKSSAPVLAALASLEQWFGEQPRATTKPVDELPNEVITMGWEAHVITDTGAVNRAAYTCCVLDGLRRGLRRRDIYTPNSIRWVTREPNSSTLTCGINNVTRHVPGSR